MDLSQEELEKFNIELKALLIKYDVTLTIGQSIQVTKKQKPHVQTKSKKR